MTNEEFQKLVLDQLSGLRTDVIEIKQQQSKMEFRLDRMEARLDTMETRLDRMEARLDKLETTQNNMLITQNEMLITQNEMYQVVKAIEHSNQVGKAELDKHQFRISKIEGKFKKAAKIFYTEEVDTASNL